MSLHLSHKWLIINNKYLIISLNLCSTAKQLVIMFCHKSCSTHALDFCFFFNVACLFVLYVQKCIYRFNVDSKICNIRRHTFGACIQHASEREYISGTPIDRVGMAESSTLNLKRSNWTIIQPPQITKKKI